MRAKSREGRTNVEAWDQKEGGWRQEKNKKTGLSQGKTQVNKKGRNWVSARAREKTSKRRGCEALQSVNQ